MANQKIFFKQKKHPFSFWGADGANRAHIQLCDSQIGLDLPADMIFQVF